MLEYFRTLRPVKIHGNMISARQFFQSEYAIVRKYIRKREVVRLRSSTKNLNIIKGKAYSMIQIVDGKQKTLPCLTIVRFETIPKAPKGASKKKIKGGKVNAKKN